MRTLFASLCCIRTGRAGILESDVQGLLSLCGSLITDAKPATSTRFAFSQKKSQSQGRSALDCAKTAVEFADQPQHLLPAASVAHLLRSVQVLLQPTAEARYVYSSKFIFIFMLTRTLYTTSQCKALYFFKSLSPLAFEEVCINILFSY